MAFNLSAELVYTNVVNLIDLAAVPLDVPDRGPEDPLVIAGGTAPSILSRWPTSSMPSSWVTARVVAGEINETVRMWLARPATERVRSELWLALAAVEGVYVPALYCSTYVDGRRRRPCPPGPVCLERRPPAPDRPGHWPYPAHPLVPLTEVVHDRLNVEVFRGCTRGPPLLPSGHGHPPCSRAAGGYTKDGGEPRAGLERPRRG